MHKTGVYGAVCGVVWGHVGAAWGQRRVSIDIHSDAALS